MTLSKPFAISKKMVWEAYKAVKANKGAPGIDGQSIESFERNLARSARLSRRVFADRHHHISD